MSDWTWITHPGFETVRFYEITAASIDTEFWNMFRKLARVPNVTLVHFTDGWGDMWFVEHGPGAKDPAARGVDKEEAMDFLRRGNL